MAASQATQIYLIIGIAFVIVLLMAGSIIIFVIFYQKRMLQEQIKRQTLEHDFQKKMLQAQLESQENERRKIAADLHDSIGGMLSTVRVGVATISKALPDPAVLNPTKKLLDESIESVRRISRELIPATLQKFGLRSAIYELVETAHAASGIAVTLLDEEADYDRIPGDKSLFIYRILQELLNNALKHSRANQIAIGISTAEHLNMFVQDDGIGFLATQNQTGSRTTSLGLHTLQARAQLLGGQLIFENQEKGVKAVLTVPLHAQVESLHR